MRIIAYRLIEAKSFDLAIKILRDAIKIREEEPQSYRNLALALDAKADNLLKNNQKEEANICFKEALENHFDKNLSQILNDDIRIVLSWDADQTDIDLWVTEPSGEKIDYSHNRSTIGGRMSRDFSNGYGPEEYTVKKAMQGKYKIQANFYGSS